MLDRIKELDGSTINWDKVHHVSDEAPIVDVCIKQKIGNCDSCPLVVHLKENGVSLNRNETTAAALVVEHTRCPLGESLQLRDLGKKSIW